MTTTVPPKMSDRSRRNVMGVALLAVALVAVVHLLLLLTPERWVDNPGRKATSVTWRTSTSLAIAAVVLLAGALSIGPARVLRGDRPAVHLALRRTLGITGAVVASIHVLVALNVHGSLWRPWRQFVTGRPTLDDPFVMLRGARGYANYLGLLAIGVLVALAALSRRSWMRRLGTLRWKTAQRATYFAFAAITLHAFLYWRVERRLAAHQVLVLLPIATAAALQLTAATTVTLRARRSRRGPPGVRAE